MKRVGYNDIGFEYFSKKRELQEKILKCSPNAYFCYISDKAACTSQDEMLCNDMNDCEEKV